MSEEEMILRMFRSIYASLMSRMNEFCSTYQLTGVQCLIMLELQEDEVTISELAQRMMMKPSNVSGVVKRMESVGWYSEDAVRRMNVSFMYPYSRKR